jgi:2-phospho-L-lactate transferase/gluconeogenesis factor (CofD/UPF0052 family)
VLRGLKACSATSAIVTVADDGAPPAGWRDLGMLPPGDIRNCLAALSNGKPC